MDDVFDPAYWKDRIQKCGGDLQRAMYTGNAEQFARQHRRQMSQIQTHTANVKNLLDVGCAYGRLLQMMKEDWKGDYWGVDISPEFVRLAQVFFPSRTFSTLDARQLDLLFTPQQFDLAVALWVREPVIKYKGVEEWLKIEYQMQKVAKQVLILD